MSVQGFQCGLQLHRQTERVQRLGRTTALLWHALADVLPQVAEFRHFAAGDVVGNRYPRQLDDAAFDRIHQRKIAHGPREQGSFDVA